MTNCTDCMLDGTDACPRGSGRAIDDETCEEYLDFDKWWDCLDDIEREEYNELMKGENE